MIPARRSKVRTSAASRIRSRSPREPRLTPGFFPLAAAQSESARTKRAPNGVSVLPVTVPGPGRCDQAIRASNARHQERVACSAEPVSSRLRRSRRSLQPRSSRPPRRRMRAAPASRAAASTSAASAAAPVILACASIIGGTGTATGMSAGTVRGSLVSARRLSRPRPMAECSHGKTRCSRPRRCRPNSFTRLCASG
jgi:hypothetical protein